MVEMQETANILNKATEEPDHPRRNWPRHRDLRRLEHRVGRDRDLATKPARRPKTLFATHYQELTQLRKTPFASSIPRRRERVERRHRVPAPGGARPRRSQLRHTGGTAGGPATQVIDRAKRSWARSSPTNSRAAASQRSARTPVRPQQQLGLFQPPPSVDEGCAERSRPSTSIA